MNWNWQQDEWPDFTYDVGRLLSAEGEFLKQGGMLLGAFKHLKPDDENELMTEAATNEAMTTSAIEGEVLDRHSVRSSILRLLGFEAEPRRASDREEGIARMMVDVLRNGAGTLSHDTLWNWHRMLMEGREDLPESGSYRTRTEPMRIVSGPVGRETVHFEAPPAQRVRGEMERFIDWFNRTQGSMPALARAGIAHVYFESIHPFEDGNGRIGRAIAECALAQGLGQPSLVLLSKEIGSRRNEYYEDLERASRDCEITAWLVWFADVVLASQRSTQASIDFLIAKTHLLDALRGKLNGRQERVLLRMLREGPAGFAGGLSSANYQSVTGASPATAGRDLVELVVLGALRRTGEGKGTRYWLVLE